MASDVSVERATGGGSEASPRMVSLLFFRVLSLCFTFTAHLLSATCRFLAWSSRLRLHYDPTTILICSHGYAHAHIPSLYAFTPLLHLLSWSLTSHLSIR